MNFLSESELKRSFERFDLFKNTPKHIAQLFDDSFLRNQNYTIRQDKAFSTFFANCREEYIELISTKSPDQLTQDEKKELMARANDMENKMYDYMMAWEKRYGSTAERFFTLHGCEYPELWDLYKQIHCNTSSTAAVERSFSIQGYLQTPRRNRLSGPKLSGLMFININVSFAREYGYLDDLCKFIELGDNIETVI